MKYGYIDVYGKFYDCGEKNHIQIDRKVYQNYCENYNISYDKLLDQNHVEYLLLIQFGFLKISKSFYKGDTIYYGRKLTKSQFNTLNNMFGQNHVFNIDNQSKQLYRIQYDYYEKRNS